MQYNQINQLIIDYNEIQQNTMGKIRDDYKDLPKAAKDRIFNRIIDSNKETFIANAKGLLSELKSKLTIVEDELRKISLAIEQTKIFIYMVTGDKELYIDIPIFNSPETNPIEIINLVKEYGQGV